MEHSLQTYQRPVGAALVMTLITLSITVILLVGFLSTMLTERRAATTFEDTERVKLISHGAVSHAIEILRTNIPEPARLSEGPQNAPGENWVTNPGRLTVIRENAQPVYIPLHTGEVTEPPKPGAPRDAESVDLNQPLPGETVPAITGTAGLTGTERPVMRVKWVNLFRNPEEAASVSNPLVGRYAFWMDDETARLNINTAVGKPAPRADADYDAQVAANFMTPLFKRGTKDIVYQKKYLPEWALGRPQSVNLDVLFNSPSQLLSDRLIDYVFIHGYQRRPEAILDFTTLKGKDAQDWFDASRYELTAYSRSPEFNAFGRSRFFTTYFPLSLEGGPGYQQPFVHDPTDKYLDTSEDNVIHLNSLLGTFGFTSKTVNEDGDTILGGNVVNQIQVDMLTEYLHRRWPGYRYSLAEKYGDAGVRQIALNAMLMARMATTEIGAPIANFSRAYSARTTSVNYAPPNFNTENRWPEAMYWRFKELGQDKVFLPQIPGPHITEVRLFVAATEANPAPYGNSDWKDASGTKVTSPRYLKYWYEVEYYMHPFGPILDLAEYPTRMDYFEIEAKGQVTTVRQQFGPSEASPPSSIQSTDYDADWNYGGTQSPINLRRMVIPPDSVNSGWPTASESLIIGPAGSTMNGQAVPNRWVRSSAVFMVGEDGSKLLPDRTNGNSDSHWTPKIFDPAKDRFITLNIRFRPGMGIRNDARRPRQMIPLGETREDTLKATFTVDLLELNRDQAVSWQISDPRLSHILAEWEKGKTGPGPTNSIGTPGQRERTPLPAVIDPRLGQNVNEPDENSPEKSKFRYLQRTSTGSKIANYEYDRPDEYDPRSRISSIGYWSLLHTGMQSGTPWRTLDLGAEGDPDGPLVGNGKSNYERGLPPDWLFLDLLGATYPMASDQWRIEMNRPDEFSTASFMNSTAGQINLNSRIYPRTPYFNPPARTRPLQAVFLNLPNVDATQLAEGIEGYQTDSRLFNYVGELSNVYTFSGGAPGTTPWSKETVLRNMAGVLTTKSNTFGVWGAAQIVKKIPKNSKYGEFEAGDEVVAEKRFYALVERYIWPGRDGVPGNGHVDPKTYRWDRLAIQPSVISTASGMTETLFGLPGSPPMARGGSGQRLVLESTGSYPIFDGPERVSMTFSTATALGKVNWSESKLEDAYNPPQPVIKYRVVSFKYLDQ